MFDIQWGVVNGVFRIEHRTYFDGNDNLMLDLTQSNLVENIKGKHRYSYIDADLPQIESWQYMEDAGAFAPFNFRYDNNCVTIGEREDYIADKFNNNINQITGFPQEVSDQGFVLIATKDNIIISEQGSGVPVSFISNLSMSFEKLVERFHRHNRPLRNPENSDFVASSLRETRQQEPLSISICCDDLNTFNPLDRVKTQLGWGKVEEAEYRDPEQVLELTLKFKA